MASGMEQGEGSGSTERTSSPSLEELLRSLNLTGKDIKGISVAKEEVASLKAGSRWMAVMRLLSSKPFSATSLKKKMWFAWAPA